MAATEEGEYREVTALFCDLGGYTAWNEEEEPESVVFVMDRIKSAAISIIERHGGITNQFVGDEIVGLFGIAEHHDDDPARAVSAALELHHFVRNQTVFRADGERRLLEMHSGVEAGLVLVRAGNHRGGLYDVVGDSINVAARLRALAPLGDILCGPSVWQRLGQRFDTEAREQAALHGKAQPVRSYRVLGARRRQNSGIEANGLLLTAYTGREATLQTLRDAWRDALAGHGALLVFEGPPGIGKSRLFHEFRRWLSEHHDPLEQRVLSGRCLPYGNTAPYQPFIDALLDHFQLPLEDPESQQKVIERLASVADLSAASADALRHLLAPHALRTDIQDRSGEDIRAAIVAALTEFVLRPDLPLLLSLEDWHVADEASQLTLRHIARALTNARALVIVNRRPREGAHVERGAEPENARLIVLAPLDEPTTTRLASRALSEAKLTPAVMRFITERSLGNPFFVEEICRSLRDNDALVAHDGELHLHGAPERIPVPDSVQAVVRSRVSRLLVHQRRALCVASVLGLEFSREDVTALWAQPYRGSAAAVDGATDGAGQTDATGRVEPLPAIDVLLHQLVNLGLIQQHKPGAFRFQHAITQAVVYGSLSTASRRWFHDRVAHTLELRFAAGKLESVYELLAYHYGLGADRERAVRFASLAADKAWRSFSLEQASAQYAAAVASLDKVRPLDMEHKKQRVEVSTRWARVDLYNPNRRVVDALLLSQKYAEELEDGLSVCLCLNWRSWIEYALGNYASALHASNAFLRAARGAADPRLEAQAHTNVGLTHATACAYEPAIAALHQSITIRGRRDGTGNTYAKGYLGLIYGDRGEFGLATTHMEEAADLALESGRLTIIGPMLIQRGMVEIWAGAYGTCVDTARAAQAIGERIAGKYIRAMAAVLEGYAGARSQQHTLPRAIAMIADACSDLEQRGVRLHLSWCYALLAEVQYAAGDAPGAERSAKRAIARADESDALGEVAACLVLASLAANEAGAAASEQWLHRAERAAVSKASTRELTLIHAHREKL